MTSFTQWLYSPDDPDLVSKVEADIEEFRFACPNKAALVKYTVLVYDPHSDLLKLFSSDFSRRKYEAAIKSGFTLNESGKFDQWVEDCMVGGNAAYNDAIVAFVTRFNVADLPSYMLYRDVLFSEIKAAMAAPDSKSKKEALVNVATARAQLSDLETKLFTGVEVSDIRNALYVKAEKMLLQLRPEAMARQIKEGTLDIDDPYYPKKQRGRPRKQV